MFKRYLPLIYAWIAGMAVNMLVATGIHYGWIS